MKNNKNTLFILLFLIQFSGFCQEEFSEISNLNLPFTAKISEDDSQYSHNDSFLLDKSSWIKYGFNVMQKYYEHESSEYKISGQFLSKENQLLLIERDYQSESNHWLCMLDKKENIIDWLEVAYDNEEGCCSSTSIIYKDSIVITEYSIYTKPEITTKTFLITKDGFQPKTKYLVTAANGLTIRDKPTIDGEKIGKLPLGYQLKIIKDTKKYLSVKEDEEEIDGSWIEIAINDSPIFQQNNGYIFSGFIQEKDSVIKKLSDELSKFPELKEYVLYTEKTPFYMQGDFFGDGVQDLAIKASTKDGSTHIIFINKGSEANTYKILGVNDALKTTDYGWAGIFLKVNAGEVLWSNYADDWVEFENVPENKKVRLNYDALFVHAEESCGGGFIFWKNGKFNWLQQE